MRRAHPERRLERDVATALAAGDHETILVAASGGPDSAALAALVAATMPQSASLVLAHVNHGVRERAWQDEAVALALGAALGARVLTTPIPAMRPSEASLRDARYTALAAMARQAGATRVCTAHHARDQAETVLLALLRGTGPDGLTGMPRQRALDGDLTLVRPLLRVAPEELLEHCRREHLPYARDATNLDQALRRNALRTALAGLRAEFPHLDEAVARCAEILQDERGRTPRARLRSRLRAALAARGGLRDVTMERLDAAVRLLERGSRGRVHLRRGLELRVDND